MFDCFQRYLKSDEVYRDVITNPDNWLFEQSRNSWAGDWPKKESRWGKAEHATGWK